MRIENNYVNGFITTNIDSIYVNTESLDTRKYFILLRQIARKRLETGRLTRINWLEKKIVVREKELSDEQRKAMEWILENDDLLIKVIEHLVDKFAKGKQLKRGKRKDKREKLPLK